EEKAGEERKRRRAQLALAAAVVVVVTLVGFGVALAHLWQRAEGARETAEKAQGDAETARSGEEGQRKVAEGGREAANTARNLLFKAQEKLEAVEYGRTMQVAYQEWRDNNSVVTRTLLDGTKRDLRGWEWRHLDSLCDSSLLTLKGHTGIVRSASIS